MRHRRVAAAAVDVHFEIRHGGADGQPGTTAPQAPLPPEQCPGNRRWIQIVFDAFLLQQGDTSMLTARDAYLAADRMRFGGANQTELWDAFAKRGLGRSASTDTTEDDEPKPAFDSADHCMGVRSGSRPNPSPGTRFSKGSCTRSGSMGTSCMPISSP